MGQIAPPPLRHREPNEKTQLLGRPVEEFDIRALMEENAQLRELVIHLSKLVIKNVMDHN